MKYISFIDQLGLDIDQLSNIDSKGIIKLQKQLKAKAMLGDATNLGEITHIIEQLQDDSTRQCHIFIEHHKWLKQLISGGYDLIQQGEIDVEKLEPENLEDLKYFLSPYLKENLKVFLSETLKKGKYVLLLKVLIHNYLFTEEINQLVINFFKARLNYATVYLREGRYKEQLSSVGFITNKVFINCLNEYPDCFNEEIQELNSEVIDIYNAKRKNVNNYAFRFMAKAMVAFSNLDTSNVFLEQLFESNASIAREYTYTSSSTRKTGSGYSGWSVFIIIMIVIRVIFWISKSSSSSDYEYIRAGDTTFQYSEQMQRIIDSLKTESEQNNFPDIEETVIESTDNESEDTEPTENDNRFKSANHIRFIYTLKRKVERKTSNEVSATKLIPFSNPYPKTFNEIPTTKDMSDNTFLKLENESQQDLIVFRFKKGIDESLYIPKNETALIKVIANDSLVFYTGKDFVTSKFSHFKRNTDLTNMFQIKCFDTSVPKAITIHPFSDEIIKVNSSSSDKVIVNKKRKEKLTSKNLELYTIKINDLYTDYYNRKFRN